MCVYIYMYICINGGSSCLPVPSPGGVRSPEVVLMLVWTLRAQPDWKCLGNCVDHTSKMSSLTKGQGTWDMHPSTSLGENNHKSLPSARVCRAGSCRKLSEGDRGAGAVYQASVPRECGWTSASSVKDITAVSFLGIFP